MKRILNFFRKDLWRKLSALVLACLLYWNLSDREKTTKNITVPMTIDAAAGLFVPEDFKLEVRTTVKGTERSLRNLKIKGTVKVDRSDRQNGRFRIRLDDRNFERRKDVEVTKVEPEQIELPVQVYIQREVKIVPKTGGKVQDGYELKSLGCNPSTIRISGPENEVNAIENIETETVVKVEIAPLHNSRKVFNNIPVRYLLPQSTLAVQNPFSIVPSLSKVSVTVIAPQAVLEDIEPEKLYVVADLSAESFTGTVAKLDVRLFCPAALKNFASGRIQNIEIHPSAVTITVRPDKDNDKP